MKNKLPPYAVSEEWCLAVNIAERTKVNFGLVNFAAAGHSECPRLPENGAAIVVHLQFFWMLPVRQHHIFGCC